MGEKVAEFKILYSLLLHRQHVHVLEVLRGVLYPKVHSN